jgi:hypothetical protein
VRERSAIVSARWTGTFLAVAILVAVASPAAAAAATTTPAATAGSSSSVAVAQAYAAQAEATDAWIGTPGVLATGVGRTAANRPSVVVFVADSSVSVPAAVDGVPTTKIVSGPVVPLSCTGPPFVSRCDRPVPLGVSAGHYLVTAGTIGALVEDATGQQYALSNNHVFANENTANIGDPILQPGAVDGGNPANPADLLGTLAAFQPVVTCSSSCSSAPGNTIDAALAAVAPGTVSRTTACGWTPSVNAVSAASLAVGTPVKKCGRSSGETTGTVTAVNVTAIVSFGSSSNAARFDGQIATTSIAIAGDSGSLVADSSGRPLGMVMAGGSGVTFLNPIDAVLQHFGVTIDDGIPGPPPVPQGASCQSPPNPWGPKAVAGLSTPDGGGFWLAAADGRVSSEGNATFEGDASCLPLNGPILGGASRPSGVGYWLNASDGGVFTYGSARFFGSMGGTRLNQPVFSMASTRTGNGYWLVAYDGGIFSFGDAPFYGSTGSLHLVQPVIAISSSSSGAGYRLVGRDGGIFSFGDAPFFGSLPGAGVHVSDVIGIAPTPSGQGYWIIRAGGQAYAFGDAPYFGNGSASAFDPVVGVIANPAAAGYRLVLASGATAAFGDAPG